MDSGLETTPTSAISVGVVYDQKLVWSQGFGKRNVTAPNTVAGNQVDENTIYRIGSISKIFAMLAMMKARDKGILSLDDPISKHVPSFSVRPPPHNPTTPGNTGVTFKSLAFHMAGMTRETPCDNQPCQMNDDTAWQRIAQTNQILPPYTMPIYSNLGFEILGHATRIATQSKTYQGMIQQTVLNPLNLSSTGVNMTSGVVGNPLRFNRLALPYVEGNSGAEKQSSGVEQQSNGRTEHHGVARTKHRSGVEQQSSGVARTKHHGVARTKHRGAARPRRLQRTKYKQQAATGSRTPVPCGNFCLEDFGWSQPSGGMFSTVADLSSLMSMIFQYDNASTSTFLRASTLREILLPHYITSDRQGGYALTFELYKIGDYMIRTKRGDVDGYASEIIMIPELKVGIVVLSSMVEHAQYIAQRMTGMLLPQFDSYFRSSNVQTGSPPFPLSKYVGLYETTSTTTTSTTAPNGSSSLNVNVVGTTLVVDWNRSRLHFESVVVDKNEMTTTHLFRLLPWNGEAFGPGAKSCSETQMDDWYELLKFTVSDSVVVSLSVDFVYGVVWDKKT